MNSGTSALSIARMVSPSGWSEPAQIPSFDEFTVVSADDSSQTRDTVHQVSEGQAIWASSGEWIRYSTPGPGGCRIYSGMHACFLTRDRHRDDNK